MDNTLVKPPITLRHLLQSDDLRIPELTFTSLTIDSRDVTPGSLFLAVAGHSHDAKTYIPDAINRGCKAVMYDNDLGVLQWPDTPVAFIGVKNLSAKTGSIASRFYGHPSRKIPVVGVTGTNGKTTVTHLMAQMAAQLMIKTGSIGTLGAGIYPQFSPTGNTTPSSVQIQKLLNNFVNQRARLAVMEVSSHAIKQHRIDGTHFSVGVFTNLTQDHLDYHGTLQDYVAAKKQFFTHSDMQQAVLNIDCQVGWHFYQSVKNKFPCIKVSTKINSSAADIYPLSLSQNNTGYEGSIKTPRGCYPFYLPLTGHFNVSNFLCAVAGFYALNANMEQIINSATELNPVPGRLQTIYKSGKPRCVIDYAHTPDALEKILYTLKKQTQGKLICVFGCGGDRDKLKRPKMGDVASRTADIVILTDDNPRSEAPGSIIADIIKGIGEKLKIKIIQPREKAICEAINGATPTDIVLIAGKGHETYQTTSGQGNDLTDFSVVQYALGNL